jgi:hypothetical protein
MAYSGAWKTGAYKQPSLQGTVPQLEHRQPVDTVVNANWQNAPQNPPLPPEEIVHQGDFTLDSAPGGPTWIPGGHDFGPGYGAGLSWAAAMAQNNAYRNTDDGSIEARSTEPVVAFDGEYHVDRLQMQYGGNLAPAGTPDLPAAPGMAQGLNTAEYPNRRVGHYIPRWRDRVYLRRNWNVEFRPIVVPNAYTAPKQQPYADGNPYTSPYAAAQTTQVRVVNTVAPQTRRNPDPWDESITTDGTSVNVANIPNYGFASF